MAQKVQVTLVDDLDGSEADETVSFALDGTSYEIDLSSANAVELRDTMARWVGSARRASGRSSNGRSSRSSRSSGASSDRQRLADVREWARKNGHQVSDRGRIAASVLAAYEAAH